jgi:hypothetical protein
MVHHAGMPPPLSQQQAHAIAARAAVHARAAAEIVYAARLRPPPGAGRIARFAYGLGLPLALVHALLGDPGARRRYLRACTLQAGIPLFLGALFLVGNRDMVETFARGPRVDLQVDLDEPPAGVPPLDDLARVPEALRPLAEEAREEASKSHDKPRSLLDRGLLFWSALYGTLCVTGWIVVAISREHHEAVSFHAARLTGIPPEGAPLEPRIHVDFSWIAKTLRRKAHGYLLFLAGALGLGLLGVLPVIGEALVAASTTVWGAYWLAVFVGAKSGHSWVYEETAPPPWFLARWERLTESTPLLHWWLPRAYGRLLRLLSTRFFSPAYRFERCRYELAGLTLARVLFGLPGIYMFMRPLVPVAAAHIFVAEEEQLSAAVLAAEQTASGAPGTA